MFVANSFRRVANLTPSNNALFTRRTGSVLSTLPRTVNYAVPGQTTTTSALETVLVREITKTRPLTKEEKINKRFRYKLFLAQKKKNGDKVVRLMNTMRIFNVEKDGRIYHSAINAAVRSNRVELAHQYISEMEEKGIKIHPHIISFMIDACRYGNEEEKAQAYMDQLIENYNKNVQDTNSEAEKEDYAITIKTFTNLINVYAQAGNEDMARKTLEQMKSFGIQPNTATYCALLKLYAGKDRENLSKALDLMEEMKEQSIDIDYGIYNTMILACKMPEQLHIVERMFEEMDSFDMKKDTTTYYNVMRKCAESKEYDKLLKYYLMARENHVKPDSRAYKLMFNSSIEDDGNPKLKNAAWKDLIHAANNNIKNIKPVLYELYQQARQKCVDARTERNKQIRLAHKDWKMKDLEQQQELADELASIKAKMMEESKERKRIQREKREESRRAIARKAQQRVGVVEMDEEVDEDDENYADLDSNEDVQETGKKNKKKKKKNKEENNE